MVKSELLKLRSWLSDEVERRRKLGGYSQEAESILNLFEVHLKLADHCLAVDKTIYKILHPKKQKT